MRKLRKRCVKRLFLKHLSTFTDSVFETGLSVYVAIWVSPKSLDVIQTSLRNTLYVWSYLFYSKFWFLCSFACIVFTNKLITPYICFKHCISWILSIHALSIVNQWFTSSSFISFLSNIKLVSVPFLCFFFNSRKTLPLLIASGLSILYVEIQKYCYSKLIQSIYIQMCVILSHSFQ